MSDIIKTSEDACPVIELKYDEETGCSSILVSALWYERAGVSLSSSKLQAAGENFSNELSRKVFELVAEEFGLFIIKARDSLGLVTGFRWAKGLSEVMTKTGKVGKYDVKG